MKNEDRIADLRSIRNLQSHVDDTDQPSMSRTSPARGPFCDSSGVNSTRCPSRSNSNTAPRTELRWKKCSIPPSSRMNPNPLSIRRRAIVPVGIPEALRSEPPGISQGNSAGCGRLRREAVGGRGPAESVQLSAELENLGQSRQFNPGSQAGAAL